MKRGVSLSGPVRIQEPGEYQVGKEQTPRRLGALWAVWVWGGAMFADTISLL